MLEPILFLNPEYDHDLGYHKGEFIGAQVGSTEVKCIERLAHEEEQAKIDTRGGVVSKLTEDNKVKRTEIDTDPEKKHFRFLESLNTENIRAGITDGYLNDTYNKELLELYNFINKDRDDEHDNKFTILLGSVARGLQFPNSEEYIDFTINLKVDPEGSTPEDVPTDAPGSTPEDVPTDVPKAPPVKEVIITIKNEENNTPPITFSDTDTSLKKRTENPNVKLIAYRGAMSKISLTKTKKSPDKVVPSEGSYLKIDIFGSTKMQNPPNIWNRFLKYARDMFVQEISDVLTSSKENDRSVPQIKTGDTQLSWADICKNFFDEHFLIVCGSEGSDPSINIIQRKNPNIITLIKKIAGNQISNGDLVYKIKFKKPDLSNSQTQPEPDNSQTQPQIWNLSDLDITNNFIDYQLNNKSIFKEFILEEFIHKMGNPVMDDATTMASQAKYHYAEPYDNMGDPQGKVQNETLTAARDAISAIKKIATQFHEDYPHTPAQEGGRRVTRKRRSRKNQSKRNSSRRRNMNRKQSRNRRNRNQSRNRNRSQRQRRRSRTRRN